MGSDPQARPDVSLLTPLSMMPLSTPLLRLMHGCAHRHSGTQVLRYSGTQVLRYSGTQVLRYSGTQVLRYSGTQVLRYSGTQVLRYSGTQVLRYSGTQVLRKAEQNHARPPRVLHSNLDLFPLPLGEGKGEGKPLYIASKRQKATRAAECALQPLCHGCGLTGAGCVRGDLSRLHDAFISP